MSNYSPNVPTANDKYKIKDIPFRIYNIKDIPLGICCRCGKKVWCGYFCQ